MGDANQRVVGVIGDTTADVVMKVGDYDDASVSYTHPAPNRQLVDATDFHAPIHQGNPDDEGAVNDVLDDVSEGAELFHDNNNHDNNHQDSMAEVDMTQVNMCHVGIAHVDVTLVDNNHVGEMEDEVEADKGQEDEKQVDGPT